MNKKLIAMAIAGALAAPMAAQADVSISGDARVRAAHNDADQNNESRDDRVRVRVTADLGNGVKAVGRLKSEVNKTAAADEAYLVIPVGPVTVQAGDQYATWGTGFQAKNAHKVGRVKISMKAGGWTLLAFDDAVALDAFGKNMIGAVGNVAGFKAGFLHNSAATMTNIFAMGNAGPVGIAFENADYDGQAAMLIQATMGFGNITGVVAHASFAAGTKASNYFSPISTIGTGDNVGATDIIETGKVNNVAITTDETVNLLGAVIPAAGGTIQVMVGDYSLDNIAITDLQYKTKLSEVVSTRVTYGTLSGDVTDFTRIGAQFDVKF